MNRWVGRGIVMTLLVLAAACGEWVVGPEPSLEPARIFQTLWQDFDAHYSFFELRGINWDSLYTVYEPQAARARNDEELFGALAGLLAELDDVHVILNTGPRTYHYEPTVERAFDPQLVFDRFVRNGEHAPRGWIDYGRCAADSTIGYLWISSFTGNGWGSEIDTVLASLGDVRALIIDVRNNGGGDSENAREIAARFADRERTFGYTRYRNGPRHSDFTDYIPQTIAPGGAHHFAGPVIVLTNRAVYSAAEEFVLAMRVLPSVTVLGDTTGGASGNPLVRELPNGWTYQISQWIEYTPERTTFEEVGLAPDVVVQGSREAIDRGFDRVLVAAVRRVMGAGGGTGRP